MHGTLTSSTDAPLTNLVSDNVLVEDVYRLLQTTPRMSAGQLAAHVLNITHLDDDIAATFIAELLGDDARFRITENHHVELNRTLTAHRLDESEFVVVDVETTGARATAHRVTEIGAYKIVGGRIVDEFTSLINPQQPIPFFIQSLTGITNDMVRDAPLFSDIAHEWLAFIGRACLVAHNAPFDMGFINGEIKRIYPNRRMVNPHLCTVSLSRRLVPNLSNYRLHTVAEHFQIQIHQRHRAAGDAHATAQIFLHLLERMPRHNITSIADARVSRRNEKRHRTFQT